MKASLSLLSLNHDLPAVLDVHSARRLLDEAAALEVEEGMPVRRIGRMQAFYPGRVRVHHMQAGVLMGVDDVERLVPVVGAEIKECRKTLE